MVDGAVCLLVYLGAMVGCLMRQGLVQPRGEVGVISTVKQRHYVSEIGGGELVSRVWD